MSGVSHAGLLLVTIQLWLSVSWLTAGSILVSVEDTGAAAARVEAPVCYSVNLAASESLKGSEGFWVRDTANASAHSSRFPAQVELPNDSGRGGRVWWFMPPESGRQSRFAIERAPTPFPVEMQATNDASTGQVDMLEGGKPVLRYNYQRREPGTLLQQVSSENVKYARARSDYIHPLYGPDGQELTRDWSLDHPHHRGIYWAWPEVDYQGQRGDLHALQRVFARPTGWLKLQSGPVFAQIDAENLWLWEDREPIVRERAVLRAFRATALGRCLDLEFQLTALGDEVSIARRNTDQYGGLNLRLASVLHQQITCYTDAPHRTPRKAWATWTGLLAESTPGVALTIFQHQANPDYPGDWVKFPELNWLQPTFPATGTRYVLKKDEPLVLRFRLWIHRGERIAESALADHWQAYNTSAP